MLIWCEYRKFIYINHILSSLLLLSSLSYLLEPEAQLRNPSIIAQLSHRPETSVNFLLLIQPECEWFPRG